MADEPASPNTGDGTGRISVCHDGHRNNHGLAVKRLFAGLSCKPAAGLGPVKAPMTADISLDNLSIDDI
jgi:hypothetical protein